MTMDPKLLAEAEENVGYDPTKKVQFTNEVSRRSYEEYTPEEVKASWYNNDDFRRMKRALHQEEEPSSSSSPPPTKTVRFCPQVRVRMCLNVTSGHYTKAERKACWYSRREARRIQRDAHESVKLASAAMIRRRPGDQHGICIRGLEHLLSQGRTESRLQNRRNEFDALMKEQVRQLQQAAITTDIYHDMILWNEEAIAEVCSNKTTPSKAHAYMLGLADQHDQQQRRLWEESHEERSCYGSDYDAIIYKKEDVTAFGGDYNISRRRGHPSFCSQRIESPSPAAA
eukprot:CAMPEP_0117035678 /NCGR_PEP_ID=MMETSP0472-20121206/25325_1 /TAXON_ID=693140 ORGANISM="Tiarina fusus, Strain LIS" /NCGR_SAMPLE_ID=MMETSP0472 /ASSEMBLY_ACC=CAM_ASM_000603 /LENGTH=284 /DNA_ID=CAMNT_0004745221 /DNA_START=71 /DNA_END=925 /DNA_ORIENTATION=-